MFVKRKKDGTNIGLLRMFRKYCLLKEKKWNQCWVTLPQTNINNNNLGEPQFINDEGYNLLLNNEATFGSKPWEHPDTSFFHHACFG